MLWYREFGAAETLFITLFVVAYVLYMIRVIRVARRLHTPYSAIFIKLGLRTTYFALIMVALMGPSFGTGKRELKSVGKDIMICVDLSKSMDAFDIPPTRLEKIKFEMKKIVDAFSSDRIGVIIFSAEAFIQCPLTYDQNALNLFIESMNTNLVPSSGTDFGPALRMALKKLEDENGGPQVQAKSKVIILISDGEDFGEETNDILNEVERKDIKLFTLGVGTEKGGNIYAGRTLKTDRNGRPVLTKLNAKSLQSLADKTGGQYFEINETKNDVSRLINTIGKIEGELREARFVDVTANKFIYFLVPALVLILFDLFFSVRTIRI